MHKKRRPDRGRLFFGYLLSPNQSLASVPTTEPPDAGKTGSDKSEGGRFGYQVSSWTRIYLGEVNQDHDVVEIIIPETCS